MCYEYIREPIRPASHAGFSTDELRRYLGVGRNEVSGIATRFGLTRLAGHYPERAVWRQVLGVEPRDEIEADLLRQPLEDIKWVSWVIDRKPSTVRGQIAAGTFSYPSGVQLGDTSTTSRPRTRRWIPEEIRRLAAGRRDPEFRRVEPFPPTGAAEKPAAAEGAVEAGVGVLALIAGQAPADARQRRE
ncbi:MAG: hypothetical protein KDK53_22590 [Maritimibacter sp.]|nr:hypothetical protein [Maritimibacter sp.]